NPAFSNMGVDPNNANMGVNPAFTNMGIDSNNANMGVNPTFSNMGVDPNNANMGMNPTFTNMGVNQANSNMGINPANMNLDHNNQGNKGPSLPWVGASKFAVPPYYQGAAMQNQPYQLYPEQNNENGSIFKTPEEK
ncbi:MAG: hypothetical protein ACRCWQ_05210, partial [Bacilli bacterium]